MAQLSLYLREMRVLIPTWEQQKLPVLPGNHLLQLLLTAQISPSPALSPQQPLTPIPSSRCRRGIPGVETMQSATGAGNGVTRREQDILHPTSGCIWPPGLVQLFWGNRLTAKRRKASFGGGVQRHSQSLWRTGCGPIPHP